MFRLRAFFAILLLLFFFPLWRYLDFLIITLLSPGLFTAAMSVLILICFFVPLRLLKPTIPRIHLFLIWISITVLAYLGAGLSGNETDDIAARHCGFSSFTGAFFVLRPLLPPAHQDDLEVRNQMCWVRKLITEVPEDIPDVKELQDYLEMIRQKLLGPERKYKATLPLIALLHAHLSANLSGTALESVEVGKMFVESLHFWKSQYTVEISALDYPWYAWPHAAYIQFEYGLIERNWESLVDGIRIENR